MTDFENRDLAEGSLPLRERITFAEQWADFEREVMPKNALHVQRVETKRAFYAGALSLLALLTTDVDGGSDPSQLDMQYITGLHEEIMGQLASLVEPS